jgi:hypothetical protein
MRVLFAASLVALLAAASAQGGVRLETRDEPVPRLLARGAHVLAPRSAPLRFNLVGLHWRGSGDVWFRTAGSGRWSAWRPARPEAEDRPDSGSPEADAARGWKLGNPYWTGPARRIQYRLAGRITSLRAHFLWSPVRPLSSGRRLPAETAQPPSPAIVNRAEWGADESIVRGGPAYADRLAFSVVHHTAGSVPSSPSQSAAVVRGIQAYHVRSNGWDDIGYNFLVDPFGRVFEGRAGGVTRNVVGAHAQGFNTGSVGVALLGTYESATATAQARSALIALIAWRLDVAHVDPASRVRWTSGGSPKYPAGTPVTLDAVSGHRDVGATSCPGSALYAQLDPLGTEAAASGLPKLYDPRVAGSLGGPVRFTARLSESRPWTVTVFDGSGRTVASGAGSGTTVDWTWNATGVSAGRYTYAIEAGSDVRPARGPVGALVPLELTRLAVAPRIVTPNGDGVADRAQVRVTLTRAAALSLWVETRAGERVATLASGRAVGAGTTAIAWGARVADARYRVVARAEDGAERAEGSAAVTVDRTLGHFFVRPAAFSPNGDGRFDSVSLSYRLAKQAAVRLRIVAGSRTLATLASGRQEGVVSLAWDGRGGRNGTLTAVLEATTSLGKRRLVEELAFDTRPPRLIGLTARRVRRGTLIRFRLNEPARLTIGIGRRTWNLSRGAGPVSIWRRSRPRVVTVAAVDRVANGTSRTARVR